MLITPLEFPSGVLAIGSPLYIERPPIESLCYQNIAIPGSLTRIKAPRHMGKSSLLVRVLAQAETLGYQRALVDFQSADVSVYSSLSRFLRWFCMAVARALKLPPRLADYWDDEIGAKLSCTIYFEEYILTASDTPIVLALNEVNQVLKHADIASGFLPLLRVWYEQGKYNDAFSRLRTVVVHSTDIYVPLKLHQSPFNVGLPIQLTPFTIDQVQVLAKRYQLCLDEDLDALVTLVGGHPYLVSMALYYLAQQRFSLPQLLADAPTPAGIYSQHLNDCLNEIRQCPVLSEALDQVMMALQPVEIDATAAQQLASLGLVRLEGHTCRPACELYRLFFSRHGRAISSPALHYRQLEAENLQLKALVNLDGLTKVANRRSFDQRLNLEWQQTICKGSRLSLIMLDIDCFKDYNDTYGHQAGDRCLQEVAKALRYSLRQSLGWVARYGGEEFAIIFPNTDLPTALMTARKICDRIRSLNIPHRTSRLPCQVVTVSLGLASFIPKPSQSVASLVKAADVALYDAKHCGRDRIAVASTLSHRVLHKVG
ncbi:MAG: AAA-like domain-containing protein [Cyanobacteria bacterium P01_B01_bin.77]